MPMRITTPEQLRELYDQPKERAQTKKQNALEAHSKKFIGLSPFLVLSTVSAIGQLDASPRGGVPGFIKILDDKRLLIPDSKGNNLLDSISNILETGRVGILFMIPGMDETFRVNGKAHISTEKVLIDQFDPEKKEIISCIVVQIEEMFFHCAKAFMLSKLWSSEHKIDRGEMPSMGQMLKDQIKHDGPVETREEMLKRYSQDV